MFTTLFSSDYPIVQVLLGFHIGLSFVFSFVLKSKEEDPIEGNYAKSHWSYLSFTLLFLAYLCVPVYLLELYFIWDRRIYLTSGTRENLLDSRNANLQRELNNEIAYGRIKKSVIRGLGFLIQAKELSARDYYRCEKDLKRLRKYYNRSFPSNSNEVLTESDLKIFIELMKSQKNISKD